jgi:hypothetical protein
MLQPLAEHASQSSSYNKGLGCNNNILVLDGWLEGQMTDQK